jgi:hypothetical protein
MVIIATAHEWIKRPEVKKSRELWARKTPRKKLSQEQTHLEERAKERQKTAAQEIMSKGNIYQTRYRK